MSKHKHTPAATPPVSSPDAQSSAGSTEPKPALAKEKPFNPECHTIEEWHRHNTIHSPFMA
jgi:hypothetical protein